MAPNTPKKKAATPAAKKDPVFRHKWLSEYGLEISGRDMKTSEVTSLRCRFCDFGREDVDDGESHQRKKRHIFNSIIRLGDPIT